MQENGAWNQLLVLRVSITKTATPAAKMMKYIKSDNSGIFIIPERVSLKIAMQVKKNSNISAPLFIKRSQPKQKNRKKKTD
ncbi:MAG: hypothetical protein E6579_02605 [Clostridium sp.]|nr:hypothetical protein [Clostridium sp.]